MKRGYRCLILQPISEKNGWYKNIEQILNFLLKYKPIKNAKPHDTFKMWIFLLECQNPIKNIK